MTTQTTTLTEFIMQRIAEDEAAARALSADLDRPWLDWCDLIWRKWAEVDSGADHLERHDPARVLAQCEAKRALIDWIFENAVDIDGEWGDGCPVDRIRAGECRDHGATAARTPLAALALPFADHPDFDESWRP